MLNQQKKHYVEIVHFSTKPKQSLIVLQYGIGGSTTEEWDTIEAGDLGYCEAFDFKCASARTCDAWVAGGPVTD